MLACLLFVLCAAVDGANERTESVPYGSYHVTYVVCVKSYKIVN